MHPYHHKVKQPVQLECSRSPRKVSPLLFGGLWEIFVCLQLTTELLINITLASVPLRGGFPLIHRWRAQHKTTKPPTESSVELGLSITSNCCESPAAVQSVWDHVQCPHTQCESQSLSLMRPCWPFCAWEDTFDFHLQSSWIINLILKTKWGWFPF